VLLLISSIVGIVGIVIIRIRIHSLIGVVVILLLLLQIATGLAFGSLIPSTSSTTATAAFVATLL
jgi:hypothetical protein